MPPLWPILLDVLPPVLVSALALLLGGGLGRLRGARGPAWAALAIGGGYLAGQLAVRGWRGWTPRESTDWIAACALLGLLLGAGGWTRRARPAVAFLLRWLVGGAVAWAMVGKVLLRAEPTASAWGQLALIGAGAAAVWSLLEAEATPTGPACAILLCVVATGVSFALLLAESALLAQLAGGLAAALGAAAVVGSVTRAPLGMATPLSLRPALPVVVCTLLALLSAGVVYAQLPRTAALLLGAAPLALIAGRGRAARRGRRAPALLGPALLALLPVAIALVLVYRAASPWDEF